MPMKIEQIDIDGKSNIRIFLQVNPCGAGDRCVNPIDENLHVSMEWAMRESSPAVNIGKSYCFIGRDIYKNRHCIFSISHNVTSHFMSIVDYMFEKCSKRSIPHGCAALCTASIYDLFCIFFFSNTDADSPSFLANFSSILLMCWMSSSGSLSCITPK